MSILDNKWRFIGFITSFQFTSLISGVTRGGRVAHPWKVWGKFGRKVEMGKWGKREGRGKKGKERGKEEERERSKKKKWKMERENCKGEEENLKWKGERYENEQRTFVFACHFLKPLKFVWGVPKCKSLGKFSNLAHLWLYTWLRPKRLVILFQ